MILKVQRELARGSEFLIYSEDRSTVFVTIPTRSKFGRRLESVVGNGTAKAFIHATVDMEGNGVVLNGGRRGDPPRPLEAPRE